MFKLFLIFVSFLYLEASFIKEGVEAFKNKNYKKAVKLFFLSCEKNNPIGCYNLALCYAKGLGVKKDILSYGYFMKKACDNDLKNACFDLGILYEEKLNNKNKAKEYYKKACLLEDKDACFNLANLLENDDLFQAIKIYKVLCKFNYSSACVSLGVIYLEKLHKNRESIFFYDKACKLGNKDGCYNLGLIYFKNKDYSNALKYFSKGCLVYSDGESCFNVGAIYFIRNNNKKAFDFFKKSCDLDYEEGCKYLKKLNKK